MAESGSRNEERIVVRNLAFSQLLRGEPTLEDQDQGQKASTNRSAQIFGYGE